MIRDHLAVMEDLKDYASPKARLTRMLKAGRITQVRRGLFVDSMTESPRAVAGVLYGPSYLSFEFALSAHHMIPEKVQVYTSASFGKNKDKNYFTALGPFTYHCIPSGAYPHGIQRVEDEDSSYLIASPEKALCDTVYKAGLVMNIPEMADLLVSNWRIEPSDLLRLDIDFITWLAPLYRRKSLIILATYLHQGVIHG